MSSSGNRRSGRYSRNTETNETESPPAPAPAAGGGGSLVAVMGQLLQYLQAQNAAPQHGNNHAPILDHYSSVDPFDMGSRASSAAFDQSAAALDSTWDGSVHTFPPFLIALKLRAQKCHWSAAGPTGILSYAVGGSDKQLFDEYYQITEAVVEAARMGRTNDRAIQNSKAMYLCLTKSVTGDLHTNMFERAGTVDHHQDGPTLFIKIVNSTMTSSIRVSIQSQKLIRDLNPAEYEFNVSTINTKLSHLHILSSTRETKPTEYAKIQDAINIYKKIQQPSAWKNWVETQEDKFDAGDLSNANDFFNAAVIKYNSILNDNSGSFGGSLTTVLEDTVAMTTKVVESLKKKPAAQTSSKDSGNKKGASKAVPAGGNKNQPPFVTDEKNSSGKPYKVGDKKKHGAVTYYFCDCPRHRFDRHWHQHTAEDCTTRQKWLKEQDSSNKKAKATANLGEEEVPEATETETTVEEDAPTGVMAHLSNALAVADDQTKGLIAMMIDTLNQE